MSSSETEEVALPLTVIKASDQTAVFLGFSKFHDFLPKLNKAYENAVLEFYKSKCRALRDKGYKKENIQQQKAAHCLELNEFLSLNKETEEWSFYICQDKAKKVGVTKWKTVLWKKADDVDRLEKLKAGYKSRWSRAIDQVYGKDSTRDKQRAVNDQLQQAKQQAREGCRAIFRCDTIEAFLTVHGDFVWDALEQTYLALGKHREAPTAGNANYLLSFSEKFARDLFKNKVGALILDQYLDLCLRYLTRLAEKWCAGNVTDSDIASSDVSEIIHDIFKLCVPMKRARCLFYKQYGADPSPGGDWVAQRHVDQSASWKQRMTHQIPSIHDMYFKFLETPEVPSLYHHKVFTELLKPKVWPVDASKMSKTELELLENPTESDCSSPKTTDANVVFVAEISPSPLSVQGYEQKANQPYLY